MGLKVLLSGAALALGVVAAPCAGATTTFVVDNLPRTLDSKTPSGGIAAVGENTLFEGGIAGFYGQSFTAPSTDSVYATGLSFSMESNNGDDLQGPFKYRILLISTGDTIAPNNVPLTNIIFSTPELILPADSPWTDININLNKTVVVGGLSYLWVIDGYTYRDGISGQAEVGTKNNFSGGAFYYGGYLSESGVPLSSINLNPFGEDIDLAFEMTFTAVPEPSTWTMLLLGCACLGFAAHRQAKLKGGLTFSAA